jgi:SAM-dependent methyltransferase
MKKVKSYYNEHISQEDKRLDEHVFEIPATYKYIDRYLKPGDKVLDIACGTGRYAAGLLERGYLLGINDLSDKNMELALQRVGNHPNLIHTSISNALCTDIWSRETWDAVLVLGPLYHMPNRLQRIRLLGKTKSSVKTGGFVFLAFMSRSAALLHGLKNNPAGKTATNGPLRLWTEGRDDGYAVDTEWFNIAYFSHPDEINPMVREAGLKPLHLVGVEGIFGGQMELYHRLDACHQKKWMRFILDHGEDIQMVHQAKHLLSVCQNRSEKKIQ